MQKKLLLFPRDPEAQNQQVFSESSLFYWENLLNRSAFIAISMTSPDFLPSVQPVVKESSFLLLLWQHSLGILDLRLPLQTVQLLHMVIILQSMLQVFKYFLFCLFSPNLVCVSPAPSIFFQLFFSLHLKISMADKAWKLQPTSSTPDFFFGWIDLLFFIPEGRVLVQPIEKNALWGQFQSWYRAAYVSIRAVWIFFSKKSTGWSMQCGASLVLSYVLANPVGRVAIKLGTLIERFFKTSTRLRLYFFPFYALTFWELIFFLGF